MPLLIKSSELRDTLRFENEDLNWILDYPHFDWKYITSNRTWHYFSCRITLQNVSCFLEFRVFISNVNMSYVCCDDHFTIEDFFHYLAEIDPDIIFHINIFKKYFKEF